EGIIPALEPAHALAWVLRAAGTAELPHGSTVLLTLSGRGDKDVDQVMRQLQPATGLRGLNAATGGC
ncbi:MAG: tryptophan synthase subunit beta, partial [Acidimicrobiales bacterium]